MPSMKIDTEHLNQYNRKRLSQTRINYDPVKMVFHDVADGKTLRFWEMYYRYYFGDGTEPGINDAKTTQQKNKTYSVESFIKNITPQLNPAIANLPSSVKTLFQSNAPSGANSPTNTDGQKSKMTDIIAETLNNHNFGFNLPTIQDNRNLINSIEIFQIHGGRFNQVTLVNPRVSSFSHDTLNYATTDRTLELTFTFEYEYAYYTIQNLQITDAAKGRGGEPQNTSFIDPFEHSEVLELPALSFNFSAMDFIESNNPLLQSDNPILQRIGKNTQSSLGAVTGAFASNKVTRPISASALNGLAQISPTPYHPAGSTAVSTRPFAQTAQKATAMYSDVSRIGKLLGG